MWFGVIRRAVLRGMVHIIIYMIKDKTLSDIGRYCGGLALLNIEGGIDYIYWVTLNIMMFLLICMHVSFYWMCYCFFSSIYVPMT